MADDFSNIDLKRLIAVCRELAMVSRQDDIYHAISSVLRQIIDARFVACELFGLRPFRFLDGCDFDEIPDHLYDHFKKIVPQHPYAQIVSQSGQGLLTMDIFDELDVEFTETLLYDEFYRHLDVTHQMVLAMKLDPDRTLTLAVTHDAPLDAFDEKALRVLRPHIIEAYRNWESLVHAGGGKASWELEALEALGSSVILLSGDGKVRRWTSSATKLLDRYFHRSRSGRSELPIALHRGVTQHLRQVAEHPLRQPAPLVFEGVHGVLTARLFRSEQTGGWLLMLSEQRAFPSAELLGRRFGLTPQRARVLALVTEGRTNVEIGELLNISPRTVSKHLEHVYAALGVNGRAAAAARAMQIEERG